MIEYKEFALSAGEINFTKHAKPDFLMKIIMDANKLGAEGKILSGITLAHTLDNCRLAYNVPEKIDSKFAIKYQIVGIFEDDSEDIFENCDTYEEAVNYLEHSKYSAEYFKISKVWIKK